VKVQNRFWAIAFVMAFVSLIAGSIGAFAQTDAAAVLTSVTSLITDWKAVAAGLVLFLVGLSIVRKLH